MKLRFDHFKFNMTVQNGVEVHWKNVPWANGYAYIHIIVCSGARQDPVGKEGTAHFLEHMFFNGCRLWQRAEDVEHANQVTFSGSLNASTYFEETIFSGKLRTIDLPRAMNFFLNFLTEPTLDQKEMERERGVVQQEIWRKYGVKIREKHEKMVNRIKYGNHPFGRQDRSFGWTDTVAKLKMDDLKRYLEKHYHANNVKIVLAGDVSGSNLKHLDIFTRSLPSTVPAAGPLPVKSWPNPNPDRIVVSVAEVFGLNKKNRPQAADLEVFRAMPLLKNGKVLSLTRSLMSKILMEEIRRKLGATYTPSVNEWTCRDHCGLDINVTADPRRMDEVEEIVREMLGELVKGDEKHHKSFREVKASTCRRIPLYDSSARDIAKDAAEELAVMGRIIPLEENLRQVEDVQYGHVCALASSQFKLGQTFWKIAKS